MGSSRNGVPRLTRRLRGLPRTTSRRPPSLRELVRVDQLDPPHRPALDRRAVIPPARYPRTGARPRPGAPRLGAHIRRNAATTISSTSRWEDIAHLGPNPVRTRRRCRVPGLEPQSNCSLVRASTSRAPPRCRPRRRAERADWGPHILEQGPLVDRKRCADVRRREPSVPTAPTNSFLRLEASSPGCAGARIRSSRSTCGHSRAAAGGPPM